MLLAMYFNGYIIISIVIGATLGKFMCDWMVHQVAVDGKIQGERPAAGIQETTVCAAELVTDIRNSPTLLRANFCSIERMKRFLFHELRENAKGAILKACLAGYTGLLRDFDVLIDFVASTTLFTELRIHRLTHQFIHFCLCKQLIMM